MEENRLKRIVVMGRSMAGKTTLCQYLCNQDLRYHKTQSVQVINQTMLDTPGEYLECMWFRGALQVTAADADVIVLVQQATEDGTMFPPAFASQFAKPTIGVVSKSDMATPLQIEHAKVHLRAADAKEIFVTSSIEGTGFEPLLDYLGYPNLH